MILAKDQQWWDNWFLNLAVHTSTASKDPSTQVGAVLAQGKRVVGLGYNGFPRGVEDTDERYTNRDLKLKLVVHAEENACIMAGPLAKGATLYVYPTFCFPPICHNCCKTAIQYGIGELVGWEPSPEDEERAKRWGDSIKVSEMMLREAGIPWRSAGQRYK